MLTFENHAFKGLDESLKQLFAIQIAMATDIGELIQLLPRGLDVADPENFSIAKAIDKKINEAEIAADNWWPIALINTRLWARNCGLFSRR